MKNHNLVEDFHPREIIVERRPIRDREGSPVDGLHNVWITLNNPAEMNAYTTNMIKEVILALREASNDRAAVVVVLTGAGTRAFCAGGNTREYAEVYAGAPGSLLDQAVEKLCTQILYTMPDCLTKTLESLRKHKLEHWDRNRESNRAWLALNMMTEANAGFRAFHYGTKNEREANFVLLRQRLAEGARWNEELIREIAPWVAHETPDEAKVGK